jgi:hypothetical protein
MPRATALFSHTTELILYTICIFFEKVQMVNNDSCFPRENVYMNDLHTPSIATISNTVSLP